MCIKFNIIFKNSEMYIKKRKSHSSLISFHQSKYSLITKRFDSFSTTFINGIIQYKKSVHLYTTKKN